MPETQTPPAEERLAALEARLGQLESVLRRIPVLPDRYRVVEGPPGAFAVIYYGLTVEPSVIEKAVGAAMRQEPQAQKETPVEPWKHLVARRHPWRKQLYLKGRNMTVRQLLGGVKANQFTEEQAAQNYHLPVEAIREALAYAEAHPEVLELDAAYERYLLAQQGRGRGPQPVP